MCHIFRRAEVTGQWLELGKPRTNVSAFLSALTHRGRDQAWTNYISTNLVRRVVRSNGTCEADNPTLACGIGMCGEVIIATDHAKHRGNIDDDTLFLI